MRTQLLRDIRSNACYHGPYANAVTAGDYAHATTTGDDAHVTVPEITPTQLPPEITHTRYLYRWPALTQLPRNSLIATATGGHARAAPYRRKCHRVAIGYNSAARATTEGSSSWLSTNHDGARS